MIRYHLAVACDGWCLGTIDSPGDGTRPTLFFRSDAWRLI